MMVLCFPSSLVRRTTLPQKVSTTTMFAYRAVDERARDGGMGVQFGLLGAQETHAVTEIERKHGTPAGSP
jgi:hypothetical protein